MANFTFTLPDGKLFKLSGPAGATREQAERIYLQQLAAGALVGLRTGDIIQAPGAEIVKFAESRLDRGTAGVDDLPLLAINNNGIISALPLIEEPVEGINTADYVAQTSAPAVGPLTPTQVQSLAAAAVIQPSVLSQDGVGKYGFNGPQLEKSGHLKPGVSCKYLCMKQMADPNPANFTEVMRSPAVWTGKDGVRSVDDLLVNEPLQDKIQQRLLQSSYDTLLETGQITTVATDTTYPVGQVYNGSSNNGLLTVGTITAGLGLVNSLLGKAGVTDLSLANIGTLVNSATNSLTNVAGKIGNLEFGSGGLETLSNLNISGGISSAVGSVSALADRGVAQLGGLLNNATKFGVDTATAWAKGLTPDALTTTLNGLAKQGQFAINFSDFKLPLAVAGVAPAAAFKGTVNRATLDSATSKILGSGKIATPSFSPPSVNAGALSGLNLNSLTSQASSLLTNANPEGITIPGVPTSLASVGGLSTPGILGATSNGTTTGSVDLDAQQIALDKAEQLKIQAQALDPEVEVAKSRFYENSTPENYDIYMAILNKRTALYAEASRVLNSV